MVKQNRLLSGRYYSTSHTVRMFIKPGTHDASCFANGDAKTCNICTCKRRLCYLTSIEHASMLSYAMRLKNFNFFGASDAERVNSQRLYTLVKVLRMFYQCYECIIRKQMFEFSSTSIYQTSIVCTLFSLYQHTNMLAAGISLLLVAACW